MENKKQDPVVNFAEEYFYLMSLDKETLIQMLMEKNQHIQDLYDEIENHDGEH